MWSIQQRCAASDHSREVLARSPGSLVVVCAALTGTAAAAASQLIDRDASSPSLAVDAAGEAMATYTKGGRPEHVLPWGAENAIAPSVDAEQVAFRLDYSGGWSKAHRGRYWDAPAGSAYPTTVRRSPGSSRPARRPTAPTGHCRDGSVGCPIWAYLRRRSRRRRSYASHTGAGRFPRSRSRSTGRTTASNTSSARSPTAAPTSTASVPPAPACCYRATVVGPGVTPDITWEATAPGPYDPPRDASANQLERALDDPKCSA